MLLRALSGFKADFGPLLLGTSDFPANYASRNMKMFEFDLLYRLKRCGVNRRGCTRPSSYFATHSLQGKHGETPIQIFFQHQLF